MSTRARKKRRFSRRKVVFLERIALLLAAVLFLCLCIFLIRHKLSSRKEAADASDAAAQSAQTDEAALRSSEAAALTLQPQDTALKKTHYLFSFAGDCTIGSLLEWQGSLDIDFQSVVGNDYAYPLSNVKEIFEADDLTIVNLEGTFTTAKDAVVKPYRFRADPAYVQVLTAGSVEAVSTANNHSGDFKDAGLADTLSTLDAAGILHTGAGSPLIKTLEGGLTVGIVSYNTVDSALGEWQWRQDIQADIRACKEAGCNLIIGFMHWGSVEYLPEPEAWAVQLAHDMVDWGCDLIVGGHAHILQRMEYYSDVPVFYSMGNFCYGGNTNPDDMDSVIVQAEFDWDQGSGTVTRSALNVIPCEISTRSDRNDYCPTPCAKGSEEYLRILSKLKWGNSQS